jgi:hypothetical protein
LKQKAGLRVDTVELMLRGGDSGPAVVKGEVDESLILERASASNPAEPSQRDPFDDVAAHILVGAM